MKYLYFNHNLKEKTPEPKATLLHKGRLVYGNTLEILDRKGRVVARLKTGRLKTPSHQVIAWLETNAPVRVR